ncbi:ATP-Hypothetical protein cassette sub-family A ABC1 member [Nesidiocoris tenuis]|uniref:ABC transporter domain-containing protein n=2 Tax=Nesidiocoris tenuis TaxID=355587 RepID=A0ABN7A7X1_9HEMI|nr:ATP-Hypothetical protein cassette sub-family A ABC1 member [Nesidiocoris tenuis]
MEEKLEVPVMSSADVGGDVPVELAQGIQEELVVLTEMSHISSVMNKERTNINKIGKKGIKHALRQQAKRRRKNTTIAAGGGSPNVAIHRMSSSPHCELEEMTTDTSNYRQPTMTEVISSIPGFHLRVPSRKRSNKKLSAAALIEQTRDGCVDLESPDSILAGTNLKSLLNRHTFASLPQLYQYKLLQLLPPVDRVPTQSETMYRCSSTALTNEFFARACEDWRERLAEGEFTPENQAKLKAEQEREKSKLDPWKLKHFEPMWGESLREWPALPPGTMGVPVAAANAQTPPGNKKEISKGISPLNNKIAKEKPPQPSLPLRTVGAVTRAVTSYREKKAAQESCSKVDSVSSSSCQRPCQDSPVFIQASPDSTADSQMVLVVEKKEEILVEDQVEYVITDDLDSSVVVIGQEGEIIKAEDLPIDMAPADDSMEYDTELVSDLLCRGVQIKPQPTSSGENELMNYNKRRTSDRGYAPGATPPKTSRQDDDVSEEDYSVSATEEIEDTSCYIDEVGEVVEDAAKEMENLHDVVERRNGKNEDETTVSEGVAGIAIAEKGDDSNVSIAYAEKQTAFDENKTDVKEEYSESPSESSPPISIDKSNLTTVAVDVSTQNSSSEHKLGNEESKSDPEHVSPARYSIKNAQQLEAHKSSNLDPAETGVCHCDESMPQELNSNLQVDSSKEAVPPRPASDDQDFEVDKTLGDVVALEQEVADRQSCQSVKAEALNQSTSQGEKWEVIAVDPNGGTSEVACSTATDAPISTSVPALPGLSNYENVLYQEDEELKEDEAAILAAAWDVVGSSSEFQHQVSAIPCQEELEVRIQESSLPAPQWDYDRQDAKCQPQGHVKLELEVTLTPEVDSSTVSSSSSSDNGSKLATNLDSVEPSSEMHTQSTPANSIDICVKSIDSPSEVQANPNITTSYNVTSPKGPPPSSPSPVGQSQPYSHQQQLQVVVCSNEGQSVTVIPPTTIVCLPGAPVSITSSHHLQSHHHHRPPTSMMTQSSMAQSSPVLPFIALSTSTPVRALVTKSVAKSSGRSGRNNVNNCKPPPGAVNLERSYQICQAVIQNSPNRHQLRCQLKPPPSLLNKGGVTPNPPAANRVASPGNPAPNPPNRSGGRVGIVQQPHSNAAAPTSRSHVVYRHVLASSAGGIPVNMAVLPPVHSTVHQEVMRGLELRRSNSAPPHSAEATRGVRPPSAPPLPPPFASAALPASTGVGSSNCACSMRAMIACSMCGAFCHDDCLISPTSRLCVMCYDTSPSFDDGSEEKSNLTNLRNPKLKQILAMHRNINATLNELEPYMEITSLLKRINVSYENITDIIKEVPEVNNIFVRLHKFMCGNSSDVTIEKMLEPRHSVDNLRGYLNSIQDAPAVIEYQYDKELSKECNAVYKHLETSPHLKFVWRFLKPFVRGRIVYAPNITVIRRVMSRIKRYTDTPKFSSFKKERGDLKIDPRMYNTTLEKLKDLLKFYDNLNQSDNSDSKELREAFEPTIQKSFDFLKTYQEAMHGLSNEKLANIGKQISEVLKCYTSINIEHYATEEEAEKRSMELSEKNELLAQITFNNTRTDNLDPFVRYKIRMNAERMYYSSMFSLSNGPNYKPFEDLKLITFGFVYLQDIVERSIIREHTNRTDIPGYVMKQMPHPCFVEDWFLSSLGGMFPMFMVLSWVYTASMIIKSIVYEKEQKLQETMQALGMNEGIHWCSWFFDCIIPMVITVFVLSTVLVYGGVVANAEYTLVVSFLLCYAVSTITMCFLVSVFFSKANLAASSGGIIFFITYLPFPLIDAWFPQVSPAFKEIGSLLSNVALGMGSKYFALRELEGTGAKWSNVGTSPIAGDRFSISKIMFIFIIDALLYFTFAWYIGNVFPGSYGIPKNWYFPFTISYWCPSAKRVKEEEVQSEKDNVYQDSDTIEADPLHLERGVAIKQMTKIYKGGKVAIEDLSLNFYQDQITAFLGTNGAGKTTTISILTGLFPPSKGTAEIYGQDVRYQMNLIRRSLGICPQYNILFLELKGHTLGEVQVEMQTILTDLGLYNKKDTYARHLSGGMKRKLSIAIAFIGKSRTVVLDEPTAGVDPFSRMGIWNLLIKYKRGRTIILTTHNMAEADLLGDRIAIVDGGKLVCCGSNTFLKSRFGWGYVLTVDLNLSYAPNKSDTMLYNELLDGISRIVPGSRVIEKFGTEIKVNLPPVSSNIQIYESLFEYLLSNKEKCGISSFGFSDTSLEEIFLKLTSENKEQDQVSKEESNQSIKDGKYASDFEFCQNGSGRATLPNQLKTMLLKRVWRNRRNKMELCMQLLLPAILVGICMSITSNLVLIHQPEPLVADIIRCPRGTTGMPPVCTSFYQLLPESSNRSQKYLDTLKGPTGIGTGCVNGSGNKDHNCGKSLLIAEVRPENNHSIDDCSCEKGRFTCNFNSSLGHPEIVQDRRLYVWNTVNDERKRFVNPVRY